MNLFSGIFAPSFWEGFFIAFGLIHVTMVAITVYLHRAQAHRALVLGPFLSHFFRVWLWFTTGMITREWAAIHRKHHAHCEMEGDPHSPQVWLKDVTNKWKRVLRMICLWIPWRGVRKYVDESHIPETLEKHGAGTPDDWMEQNVYSRFPKLGILITLVVDITLFGALPGFCIWLAQMLATPILAAGVINGIGHFWGYRNFESKHLLTGVVDASKNISPWGVIIAGEELHNNHHAYPLSPKLSVKPNEFDIGWMWIRIFDFCGGVKSMRKIGGE